MTFTPTREVQEILIPFLDGTIKIDGSIPELHLVDGGSVEEQVNSGKWMRHFALAVRLNALIFEPTLVIGTPPSSPHISAV